MFAIEKNVAIPEALNTRQGKYPYKSMEVGDSFFVPSDDKGSPTTKMRSSVAAYCKRNNELKFIVREVEGGARVWRTA